MAHTVFTDRDLLPHILAFLDKPEQRIVRLLSRETCAAHDVQASILRARCHEEDAIAEQEVSVHRMLARGCRPTEVVVDIKTGGGARELQRLGLRLLRPFAELPRTAPLPTSQLTVDGTVLTAAIVPQLLTRAFPQLRQLVVLCEGEAVAGELAGALEKLLGAGQAGAPVPQPLLPQLEALIVNRESHDYPPLQPLPSDLAAVVRGATQLRQLRLDYNLDTAAAVADIAGLTGLQALNVGLAASAHLRALHQPLTALTFLSVDFGRPNLLASTVSGNDLAGLSQLVKLFLSGNSALDVSALSHLPQLTELQCCALVAPAAPAAAPAAGWPLPPGLRELTLYNQEPQDLPRPLRGPPQGIVTCEVHFDLKQNTHILPSGQLMPEAEASLCGAAGALAQVLSPTATSVQVHVSAVAPPGALLRPVGGAAAVGPGRRNHTPWLEALGAMRPTVLGLSGVALWHQDLDTISRMASLQGLEFKAPCTFPASALCKLPCLPALERLGIDCGGWVVGGAGPFSIVREPPEARGILLSLCCKAAGPRLKVELYHSKSLAEEVVSRLAAIVTALRAELEALGMGHRAQLSLVPV